MCATLTRDSKIAGSKGNEKEDPAKFRQGSPFTD